MARADLLASLVKFGVNNDKVKFRQVVQAIIAEERSKQHNVLAEKLEGILRTPSIEKNGSNGTQMVDHRVNYRYPKGIAAFCEAVIFLR